MVEPDSPLILNRGKRRGYGAQTAAERKKRRRAHADAERKKRANDDANDKTKVKATQVSKKGKGTTETRETKSKDKIQVQVKKMKMGRTKTARSKSKFHSDLINISPAKGLEQKKNNEVDDNDTNMNIDPFELPSSGCSNSGSDSDRDRDYDDDSTNEKEHSCSTSHRQTRATRTPKRSVMKQNRKIFIEESSLSSSSASSDGGEDEKSVLRSSRTSSSPMSNRSHHPRPIRNVRKKPLNYAEYDDISSVSSNENDNHDNESSSLRLQLSRRVRDERSRDDDHSVVGETDKDQDQDQERDLDHECRAGSYFPLTQKHMEMDDDDHEDDGGDDGDKGVGGASWTSSLEDDILDFNVQPSPGSGRRRREGTFQLVRDAYENDDDRRRAHPRKQNEDTEPEDHNDEDNDGDEKCQTNCRHADVHSSSASKKSTNSTGENTVQKENSEQEVTGTRKPKLHPKKRQEGRDIYDEDMPSAHQDKNKFLVLSNLCTTIESLKAADAKRDSLKVIVQSITQEYHNLCLSTTSFREGGEHDGDKECEMKDADREIVNTISVRLVQASLSLLEYHSKEALLLICCCIQYHTQFFHSADTGVEMKMNMEDLYNYEESHSHQGRVLPNDAKVCRDAKPLLRNIEVKIFRGVLHSLVYIVSNENDDLTIEEDGIPLIYFLHCVKPQTLVNATLNKKRVTDNVIDHLTTLVEALPQMHSYPVMELVLAFLLKFRFHVLASIEKLSEENEKTKCIDFVRRLFSEIPTNVVDGIEYMDPPLPRDVLDKLHGSRKVETMSRSRNDFVTWSRSVVIKMHCPNASFFSCNGIYAPHHAEDIGTQIAKIKWVDVNKYSISFFHCSNMSNEKTEDAQSCSLFPRHKLITIPYGHLAGKSNRGLLCDKDCALTLPISSPKFARSELQELITHGSNCGGKRLNEAEKKSQNQSNLTPSCIKIFIKRSEYAKFKATVTENRKNVNIAVGQSDDCSSTFSTVMSRSVRRKDAKMRNVQVELSTKLSPEQILDAAKLIRSGHSSHDDRSHCLSRENGGEVNIDEKSKVSAQSFYLPKQFSPARNKENMNYSQIQNPSTPSPPPSMPAEVTFYNKNQFASDPQQISKSQLQSHVRRRAAEITPLQQMNTKVPTNLGRLTYNCRRPLETLSAVWGTLDQSKMKSMSFQEFVNQSHVQETADSILCFEQTMSKASKIMNELALDHQRMMKNLKGAPNECEIGEMIGWVQSTVDTVQRSTEDWAQMRQSYEHRMAKSLWCQDD